MSCLFCIHKSLVCKILFIITVYFFVMAILKVKLLITRSDYMKADKTDVLTCNVTMTSFPQLVLRFINISVAVLIQILY